MKYGLRHSDKCSEKELKQFRKDVLDYINTEIIMTNSKVMQTPKLRAFNSFGGEVRVYTGKINERLPMRMRRRLIAYKDPKTGKWIGDKDAIKMVGQNGTQIFERHSESIKEPEYFSVYRTDWDKNEKEELKRWLNKLD